MLQEDTIILHSEKINQKLERIAYEILENNYDEDELILAGLNVRGLVVAKKLANYIHHITNMNIRIMPIKINDKNPTQTTVDLDIDESVNDKVVIIIDDVANTGRTLLYATKPFLEFIPKKIQVAVLVDRKHKIFPIAADFVGLTLSTTIQEHVSVQVKDNDIVSVTLK